MNAIEDMKHLVGFTKSLARELLKPEFKSLFLVILITISVGTVFYRFVEGWSFLDSALFSVDVLSTVGMGFLVPQTIAGRVFTAFYILIGVGILFSFISLVSREMTLFTSRNHKRKENEKYDE